MCADTDVGSSCGGDFSVSDRETLSQQVRHFIRAALLIGHKISFVLILKELCDE
jgi:hypothetical protein